MAKVTGPQEIPSELLDGYRATLGEIRPDDGVRKRYPYRVPIMQTATGHPTTKQKAQRTRFLTAKGAFVVTDWPTRQRWYAAAPEWGSLLWYYNYFIMSGIMDILGANPEGASVIKSIKHYTFNLPNGAPQNVNVVIDTIDPTKAMVFPYGAGHEVECGEDPITCWAWTVYPYLVSISANLVVMKASDWIDGITGCSISVIEYI